MSRLVWEINSALTMEEERVMCLGIFDQPLHSTQDIGLRRNLPRISSIVRQDHNILLFEIPVSCEVVALPELRYIWDDQTYS